MEDSELLRGRFIRVSLLEGPDKRIPLSGWVGFVSVITESEVALRVWAFRISWLTDRGDGTGGDGVAKLRLISSSTERRLNGNAAGALRGGVLAADERGERERGLESTVWGCKLSGTTADGGRDVTADDEDEGRGGREVTLNAGGGVRCRIGVGTILRESSGSFLTTSHPSTDGGVARPLPSSSGPDDGIAGSPPGVMASRPELWLNERRCDLRGEATRSELCSPLCGVTAAAATRASRSLMLEGDRKSRRVGVFETSASSLYDSDPTREARGDFSAAMDLSGDGGGVVFSTCFDNGDGVR
jgi:hypothetical protein